MGTGFLIDSNILIYYLTDQLSGHSLEIVENAFYTSFQISVITKIEVLGWRGHTTDGFNATQAFIKNAKIFELDAKVADKTIDLRQVYKISLPDAVIAATTLLYNLTLVTRNTKDFKHIKALKILNPFE